MKNKVLQALNKKMIMIELLARIGYPEYRAEYIEVITTMADNGEIVRTWDESGMAYYEKEGEAAGPNHYDNEFPTYYDAQGREHGEF